MKAKDIRKGNIVLFNGVPCRIMEFHHHTPGNLRALVQLRMRNLLTGSQVETKVASTDDLPEADVFTYDATFMYGDADGFHFMHSETYDQIAITTELMGDGKYYLQDGMKIMVMTFNGEPIGVQLPKSVVLVVSETEPEVKGGTVSNTGKPATTNTGLTLQVPAFIKQGEKIEVSTETGEFLGRAN